MDDVDKEDPIPSPSPSHPLQNAFEDIRGPDSEANAQMGSQQDDDDDDIQDHRLEKERKSQNEIEHAPHGSDGKLEAKSEVDAQAKMFEGLKL